MLKRNRRPRYADNGRTRPATFPDGKERVHRRLKMSAPGRGRRHASVTAMIGGNGHLPNEATNAHIGEQQRSARSAKPPITNGFAVATQAAAADGNARARPVPSHI
jgi:hypothetical protein